MVQSLVRAALFAALATVMLIPAPVVAHAELKTAVPGPGDEVVGSPQVLITRFDQNLDPSRTSLQLRNAAGVVLARGGELGAGPREFTLPLPELSPGEYKVYWTSYSTEDAELGRGTFTFTVLAAPTAPPSLSPSPWANPTAAPPTAVPGSATSVPSPSPFPQAAAPTAGEGLVVIPIAAAALLLAGVIVWMTRRRQP